MSTTDIIHARSGRWRLRHLVVAVAATAGPVVTLTAMEAPLVEAVSYALTSAVRVRTSPTSGSAYDGVAPSGTTISLNCQQWGEAQGPNGNTLWLNVNGYNRNGWWVSDTWTTSPHLAADKTNGIAGVAWCGSAGSGGSALPAPSAGTPIWFGAYATVAWPGSARSTSSLPSTHNIVFTVPGHTWKSDWSMDLYAPSGTPVKVYAAPKDNRLDSRVTASVIDIRPTCGAKFSGESDASRVARGGYAVFVGVYDGGVRVGTLAYGHLNVADRNFRGPVNRYGGQIGTVGAFTRNSCWDVSVTAGHHVHFEASNELSSTFSCYRPGELQNATIPEHEYIGYLGGSFATARQRACPSNA